MRISKKQSAVASLMILLVLPQIVLIRGFATRSFTSYVRPVASTLPHVKIFQRSYSSGSALPWSTTTSLLTSSSSDEQPETETQSINDLLSELGTSFRNRAEQNAKKCQQADSRKNKILYGIVSTFYYLLFLVYRAYRGFFVLLPAVFRRVYAKMEVAMKNGVLEEDDKEVNGALSGEANAGKMSWKSKIIVGACAAVVTSSYVLGALWRTGATFFKAIVKTKSVPDSFGAVAEEMSREDKKEDKTNSPKKDTPNDRLYP